MKKPSTWTQIEFMDFYTTLTSVQTTVGQRAIAEDGTEFRLAYAGGSALVKGNLIQSPAFATAFVDMAVQAAVATSVAVSPAFSGYPIPVTLGGTSTTSNTQFTGGKLVISVTPGIGQTFTIIANDIATNGTTCNFYVEEAVQTALTTSSKATVVLNPYNGVIQAPTTLTGIPVGVAVSAIPINNYGWLQTHGLCSTLIQSTPAIGAAVMPSGTTAGAVTTQTAGNQIVGVMAAAGTNGENEPVNLLID